MRSSLWHLLVIALTVTGCTSMCGLRHAKMTPEQVVEAYLNTAFNMQDAGERDALVEYTTGPLKAAIEAASLDTIKTAYVDRKYQLLNYSVVERKDRTPRETEITFQLTYSDLGVDSKTPKDGPKVTTENTVSVVKEAGLWYIRDVLGNKTSIDFPVSEESRITAKPGAGVDQPEDMSAPPDDPSAVEGG